MTYEKDPQRLVNSMHNLKVLYDAGIPIAMGTDNMLEMLGGDVEHRELAYYVEAGLTPMEAIVLATKNAAEHLKIDDRKGCIKPGMEADFLLLDKDPAEDISNIQFINKVFIKGNLVYSQKAIQSYEIPDYEYPTSQNIYRIEKTDGKMMREMDVREYASQGIIRHKTYQDGVVWADETYKVGKNLSVTEWHCVRKSDDTELTAELENEFIHMYGKFKGKPQDKRLRIGNGLWYQMMDMAMPAFIASDQKEIVFYSIGTGDNRGAMGLGEFAAEKLGEEEIHIGNTTYTCEKISFVLTMFSWAWTGLYWYDKKTGQLVQCGERKGKNENVTWVVKEQ
jgi:hypothetical protein